MEIKIHCAHQGCGDYRFIDIGELELTAPVEKLTEEVCFVCYRHQDEMVERGVLSDHLALYILRAERHPGIALRGHPSDIPKVEFLLKHNLLECKVEPAGFKKVTGKPWSANKRAFYTTESGRELARSFLDGNRRVTFSPHWSWWSDAELPWWERYPWNV